MSIVLSIDTASHGRIAVAMSTDTGEEHALEVDAPVDDRHRLLPLVDQVLEGRVRDLTRVVVIRGPGSFAGLRVGIAAARGLAIATGADVVGVSTLEAVAAAAGGDGIALHPLGRGELARQPFVNGTLTGSVEVVAQGDIAASPALVGEGNGVAGREVAPRERCLAALRIGRQLPAATSADPIYLRDPRITPPKRGLPGVA